MRGGSAQLCLPRTLCGAQRRPRDHWLKLNGTVRIPASTLVGLDADWVESVREDTLRDCLAVATALAEHFAVIDLYKDLAAIEYGRESARTANHLPTQHWVVISNSAELLPQRMYSMRSTQAKVRSARLSQPRWTDTFE